MRILLVDDSVRMRSILRRILSEVFDDISEAETGTEALESFEALRPDVVLMDVRLPGLDGFAASERILRSHPDARIILLTEYNEDPLRRKAYDCGLEEYFLKDQAFELRTYLLEHPLAPPRRRTE